MKLEITPVTVNTNLENPGALYDTRGFYTSHGTFIKAEEVKGASFYEASYREGKTSRSPQGSEYKRVMERRKSR